MTNKNPDSISDDQIKKLGNLLFQKLKLEKEDIQDAKIKHILTLIAKTGAVAMIIVAPKTVLVTKELFEDKKDFGTWKRFNERLLRQNLKRLDKQRIIDISIKDGKKIIKISEKGKMKILAYAIGELTLKKSSSWDGKWRLVGYDIPVKKGRKDKIIKSTLKRLGFLKIQNSVYISPYPCFDEIEFLREYYFLGTNIKYFLVTKIEDQEAYKTYFGI